MPAIGFRRTSSERRQQKRFTAPARSGPEGQGLAEFALILALMALAVIAALILLGTEITTILSSLGGLIGS